MTEATKHVKPAKMRIVCVSDTHGHATGEGFKLPTGDVLIHAGDLTNQGSLKELRKAARWLEEADFEVKLVVAGNHDLSLDQSYHLKHEEGRTVTPTETGACRQLIPSIPGVTYLEHEHCTLTLKGRTLNIFGSPFSIDNEKQNWAFQHRPADAEHIWQAIPQNTDILITHSPPAGVLDASSHWTAGGCSALLERVKAIRPLLHVFGHHHEGRGACIVEWDEQLDHGHRLRQWEDPGAGNRRQSLLDLTSFVSNEQSPSLRDSTAAVNASIMKRSWSKSAAKEFNKPIVVDISVDGLACA